MSLNQDRLNEFLTKFVADFGATMHGATILTGEKLGLYKAMAGSGPLSPGELASRTGTSERYLREWLAAQAASGYVAYDSKSGKYLLTPEQAFALANENGPLYVPGAFYIAASMFKDEPRLTEAFRSGEGVGWHEHNVDLYNGVHKFFRPNYVGNLVSSWLPSLDGVIPKLSAGARVADIGCGYGSSTIIMAEAFPKSTFVGYDYHAESVEAAREIAKQKGVSGRVSFEAVSAKDYQGKDFDLATVFDALHDMGDPVGVSAHILRSLKPDGTWMLVEPFANDIFEENLTPVSRIYYSASTMICTPSSLAQEVGLALGSQVGDTRLREIAMKAGFKQFRRAAETPFNRVFEARP